MKSTKMFFRTLLVLLLVVTSVAYVGCGKSDAEKVAEQQVIEDRRANDLKERELNLKAEEIQKSKEQSSAEQQSNTGTGNETAKEDKKVTAAGKTVVDVFGPAPINLETVVPHVGWNRNVKNCGRNYYTTAWQISPAGSDMTGMHGEIWESVADGKVKYYQKASPLDIIYGKGKYKVKLNSSATNEERIDAKLETNAAGDYYWTCIASATPMCEVNGGVIWYCWAIYMEGDEPEWAPHILENRGYIKKDDVAKFVPDCFKLKFQ